MKIKLSKSQWELIGQKTGWIKKAQFSSQEYKNDEVKVLSLDIGDPINAEDVEEDMGLESDDKIRYFTLEYKMKKTDEYKTIKGVFIYVFEPMSLGFGTAPDSGAGYHCYYEIKEGIEDKDLFNAYLNRQSDKNKPKLDEEDIGFPKWYNNSLHNG